MLNTSYLKLTREGGSEVKNPPVNAGDVRHGFDPWVRNIPGEGNGNPLQYSCLENSMDSGIMDSGLQSIGLQESDTTECVFEYACTHTDIDTHTHTHPIQL